MVQVIVSIFNGFKNMNDLFDVADASLFFQFFKNELVFFNLVLSFLENTGILLDGRVIL